jgi:putative membrane protein
MKKILHSTLVLAASLLLMFSMSALAQSSGSADQKASDAGSASRPKTAKSDNTAKSDRASSADQQFAKKAAEGGKAEVELGNLAVQKASNDDVKKFGQRMVDDHTKAGQQLQSTASSEGITLPDQPSAKQTAEKEKLSKLSGPAFDKAYMNYEVKDHEHDVADFQKEAKNGKDSAVKEFASSTLPTLQSHLDEAKRVDKELNGSNSAMNENNPAQSASNKKSKY